MTPSHDYYFTLILYAKNQKMIDDPSMPQHDWLSKFLKMITVTGQLEVRCSYGSPWNVTWQQASVYEIPYHVVLSGRAMIEDTESGATFEVGSGDIVLFPYGSPHTLHDGSGQTPAAKRIRKMQGGWTYNENDGEGERLDMLCGRFFIEPPHDRLLRKYLPTNLVVHSINETNKTSDTTRSHLSNLIELMRFESSDEKPGGRAALNALTAVLFTLTLRAASKSDAPPVGLLSLASQTRLAPAISAIFNFPERPWNIHDLANLCNMSRATFMRHFKEMSGRSAMDFLTDIRANLAANELKNPETSIEKVAESVGYQSTSAFRRIFVNKIGMTAGQWRRISRA